MICSVIMTQCLIGSVTLAALSKGVCRCKHLLPQVVTAELAVSKVPGCVLTIAAAVLATLHQM